MPEEVTRLTGPLRPIEIATASVLALPAVILTVVGWFLPHLSVIAAFGVVPFGLVSYRHRFRALMASAFAAALLSFLVAGAGTASNILACAAVGCVVGTARRRGWHFLVAMGLSGVVGLVLASISVGLLEVFRSIRKLTLEQVKSVSSGINRVFVGLSNLFTSLHRSTHAVRGVGPFFSGLARLTDDVARFAHSSGSDLVRDWWIAVLVSVVASTLGYAFIGWFMLSPVIHRLRWVEATNQLDGIDDAAPPGPLPAVFRDVSYRYPGVETDAVSGLNLEIPAGLFVALVGDNGSGKSTMARMLAGQRPTSGTVERPGSAGLGRCGGTALIMQHPETQVLGVRAADDVVWGLSDAGDVDVEGLLDDVGLGGMGGRETSTLSGGELQRLAVAAALARRPALLISDESTAMVDEEGRRILVALLHDLQADQNVGVVHVTHRMEETAGAHRRVRLAGGRVVGEEAPPSRRAESNGPTTGPTTGLTTGPTTGQLGERDRDRVEAQPLELIGVSHTYADGTPWAQPALLNIDLVIEPNDGLLIVGGNGSGKSTLAWILAGILRPTRGRSLLGGQPVAGQIGSVGLALQHARLQLQGALVGRDIRAAGAEDDDAVTAALASVGFDAGFAERHIEQLSGGQQRRVAIAGLLARRPSVLILDEPLAGLDEPSRRGLIDVLDGLRRDHGLTIVVISHDLTGVEQVCDRTVRLTAGRLEVATGVAGR